MNVCPPPRTLPTGESECPSCGRMWDRADGRPACSEAPRTRSEEAARRELARIRALLEGPSVGN